MTGRGRAFSQLAAGCLAASLVAVGLLGGCVAGAGGPPPDPALGVIEWNSGGTFSGSRGGRLYADDSYITITRPPFGEFSEQRRQLAAGSYDRALAWLRANPLPRGAIPKEPPCLDYGTDWVSWSGPASAGKPVSWFASCPNEPLAALRQGLLDEITRAASPQGNKAEKDRSDRMQIRKAADPGRVKLIRPRGRLTF